jgi:putative DNA primase/helicase
MVDLLARLTGVCRSGDGWTARCPAHDDQHNSLSIRQRDGHWLLTCRAGCGCQAIIGALGVDATDLFDDKQRGAGSFHCSDNLRPNYPELVS